tara:strand:- start:449 stop:634 length:186 start_codon:yes stop_codon:yes gene_type:complete
MEIGDLVKVLGFKGYIIATRKGITLLNNSNELIHNSKLILVRLFDGQEVWTTGKNIKVLNK